MSGFWHRTVTPVRPNYSGTLNFSRTRDFSEIMIFWTPLDIVHERNWQHRVGRKISYSKNHILTSIGRWKREKILPKDTANIVLLLKSLSREYLENFRSDLARSCAVCIFSRFPQDRLICGIKSQKNLF